MLNSNLLSMVTVMVSKINWRQRLWFLSVPTVVLVADQVTKALVRANMTLGQSIPPEGTLRLTYVTNPYGVFGFHSVFGLPLSPTFFMISTGIIVILGIWLYFHYLSMGSRLLLFRGCNPEKQSDELWKNIKLLGN